LADLALVVMLLAVAANFVSAVLQEIGGSVELEAGGWLVEPGG
jgi:hypothetical protein